MRGQIRQMGELWRGERAAHAPHWLRAAYRAPARPERPSPGRARGKGLREAAKPRRRVGGPVRLEQRELRTGSSARTFR